MDIRRLLTITRKWLLLLIAGVALAAGAALVFSMLQQRTYEARTTLIVGQSLTSVNPDYSGLLASQQLVSTYAAIATNRPQLEKVITDLNLDTTPDQLAKRVAAVTAAGSTLLVISAQDSDAERAAATANALGAALIAETSSVQGRQEDLQAAIDADLEATQAQILASQNRLTELVAQTDRTAAQDAEMTTLEGRLVVLRSTYATLLGYSSAGATNLLSVVEPAYPPSDAIAPRTLLNVLVAAILGLLLAAGIALLAEFLNESVGTAADVERLTGSRTLGSIGQMRAAEGRREYFELAVLLYPRSGISEAYRTLRANLDFAAVDSGIHTLLVTSARPGEGKSVTAANIAIAYAQAGRRVLLVDADLRKPGVHLAFGVRNDVGLTTALVVGSIGLENIAQVTHQPNLSVLPSGPEPPNPAELLSSHRMRALLEHALTVYDLVILDSPPLQPFADAAVLGSLTDGTLLVVDAERSKRRAIQEGREMLARAGAHLLGIVFNRVPGASNADLADRYGTYVAHTRPTPARTAAEAGAALAAQAPVTPSGSATAGTSVKAGRVAAPTAGAGSAEPSRAVAPVKTSEPSEVPDTVARAEPSVPPDVVERIHVASLHVASQEGDPVPDPLPGFEPEAAPADAGGNGTAAEADDAPAAEGPARRTRRTTRQD